MFWKTKELKDNGKEMIFFGQKVENEMKSS